MSTTPLSATAGDSGDTSWVDVKETEPSSLSSSVDASLQDGGTLGVAAKRSGDDNSKETTPPKSPRTAGSESRSPADGDTLKGQPGGTEGSASPNQVDFGKPVDVGGEGSDNRDHPKGTRVAQCPGADGPTEHGPANVVALLQPGGEDPGATAEEGRFTPAGQDLGCSLVLGIPVPKMPPQSAQDDPKRAHEDNMVSTSLSTEASHRYPLIFEGPPTQNHHF